MNKWNGRSTRRSYEEYLEIKREREVEGLTFAEIGRRHGGVCRNRAWELYRFINRHIKWLEKREARINAKPRETSVV